MLDEYMKKFGLRTRAGARDGPGTRSESAVLGG
jgi:hypothetical protein